MIICLSIKTAFLKKDILDMNFVFIDQRLQMKSLKEFAIESVRIVESFLNKMMKLQILMSRYRNLKIEKN